MKRKALLGFVMVLLFVLPLAGCGLTDDFKNVQTLGDTFMTALKDGDYTAAFNLFSADLQEEVVSAENLQSQVEENAAQPESWSFTNTNVSVENGDTVGKLEGTVTYQDGRTGEVELQMLKVEAVQTVWILVSFNLTW